MIRRARALARRAAGKAWGKRGNVVVSRAGGQVPERFSVEAAARLPAIEAAVGFISRRVSRLPIRITDADGAEVQDDPAAAVLMGRWGDYTGHVDGLLRFMRSVLLWGKAGAYVLRDGRGGVEAIMNLDPRGLERELVAGEVEYRYADPLTGAYCEVPRDQLIFLPFVPPADGYSDASPLEAPWDAIRAALEATAFAASYYQRGAQPTTAYAMRSSAPGGDPKAAVRDMRHIWEMEDRMRVDGRRSLVVPGAYEKPVVLGGGVADSDVAGTRRFGVEECGRIYSLPPIMLGDLQESSYANFKGSQDDARDTLEDWAVRLGFEISNVLWPGGERRMEFDAGQALRPTLLDRAKAYELMRRAGVMTANDCRRAEGLPPSDQEGADLLSLGAMAAVVEVVGSG